MVLNSPLVIKMGIDQIGKKFVKSMSVKKFSYLGQFIQGLRTPDTDTTYFPHFYDIFVRTASCKC